MYYKNYTSGKTNLNISHLPPTDSYPHHKIDFRSDIMIKFQWKFNYYVIKLQRVGFVVIKQMDHR